MTIIAIYCLIMFVTVEDKMSKTLFFGFTFFSAGMLVPIRIAQKIETNDYSGSLL